MPYCRECGTEVDGMAKFCMECGSAQQSSAEDDSPARRRETPAATATNGRAWYITGLVSAGLYSLWLLMGAFMGKFHSVAGAAIDVMTQPIMWLSVASFAVASARSRGTRAYSWARPLVALCVVTAASLLVVAFQQPTLSVREAASQATASETKRPAKASIRDRIVGIAVPAGKFFLCSTSDEVIRALGQPKTETESGMNKVLLYVGLDGSESRVTISSSNLVLSYDSTDPAFPAGAEADSAEPSIGTGASMAQVVSMYGTPHVASPSSFMYSNREASPNLRVMVVNFDDQGHVRSVMNPW